MRIPIRTHWLFALVFSLTLLGASADAGAEAPEPRAPAALVAGNTAFALDLYGRLREEPGNLFLSPYSISAALAMTREGAAGETRRQMDAVLHLPAEGAAEGFRALAEALRPRMVQDRNRKEVPAYAFSIANRLWGQQGYSFEEPFLARLSETFGAGLERVDFRQGAKAREIVNSWVARETKDRIQDIVPAGMPPQDTRLMLANAIYFKAAWKVPFSKRATKEEPFHTETGEDVEAPLMRRAGGYGYGEADGVQILEMSYRGGDTSMVVVLPRDANGLAAVEKRLDEATLALWLKSIQSRRVQVFLPRFEFTRGLDLTKTLASLGMEDAFLPMKADFSGMTTAEPLFIGIVLHKAFVKLDENGTEAAAATVVGMWAGSVHPPETPPDFRADHPFLFLIRHRATGSILFMGRVANPRA